MGERQLQLHRESKRHEERWETPYFGSTKSIYYSKFPQPSPFLLLKDRMKVTMQM